MNKDLNGIISVCRKKSKRSGTRNKPKKLLPALSHNTSSSNISAHSTNRFRNPAKLADNCKLSRAEQSKKYVKLKSLSSMDEDFDRLDIISHKHRIMRNDSLDVQQRLIEIASSVKLPVIKEVSSSFINEKKLNSQIDSVMQRYHENYRQKIKLFEVFSTNL